MLPYAVPIGRRGATSLVGPNANADGRTGAPTTPVGRTATRKVRVPPTPVGVVVPPVSATGPPATLTAAPAPVPTRATAAAVTAAPAPGTTPSMLRTTEADASSASGIAAWSPRRSAFTTGLHPALLPRRPGNEPGKDDRKLLVPLHRPRECLVLTCWDTCADLCCVPAWEQPYTEPLLVPRTQLRLQQESQSPTSSLLETLTEPSWDATHEVLSVPKRMPERRLV